jgi:integrase
LDRAELTVNQQLDCRLKGEDFSFRAPKTAAGRRTIKIPSMPVEALRKHRTEQFEKRQQMGEGYKDYGLVVCREDGRPLPHIALTNGFARLVKRAGLPHLNLHGLRHTHASDLLDRGEQILAVSKRLGHANITATLQAYGHLLKGAEDRLADRLDETLRRAMGRD